jgi:hypothetical protein
MRRRKQQNGYDGQIVKQSDGVYDIVVPKFIAPPKSYNPLIIDNIRNVGSILEQPAPSVQISRPVINEPPKGLTLSDLSEFGMSFADYDSQIERTLRAIPLTPEELSSFRSVSGNISFRGIPLDQGLRRYCKRDEVQFDLLISGQIANRFQCVKSTDVVRVLLAWFQANTAPTLVNPVQTGFGSPAIPTAFMSMMSENSQRPRSQFAPAPPNFGTQTSFGTQTGFAPAASVVTPPSSFTPPQPGPSADVLNFEQKLNQSQVPIKQKEVSTRAPGLPPNAPIAKLPEAQQKHSPEARKRDNISGAYAVWKETMIAFYSNIGKGKQAFQDLQNKPFAMTQFTDLAKFLSGVRFQTNTLLTIIGQIPNFQKPRVVPKDFKLPDFSDAKWVDRSQVTILEHEVSMADLEEADPVLIGFQDYLTGLFNQIVPIFEKIKQTTFEGLKNALDCSRESATCLRYLDTREQSILSITVVDLLNLVKSYICNIMNNISDGEIRIDADTACKLENKFDLVYDVFRFLAGSRNIKKPTNSTDFCKMLIDSLAKTTQELKDSKDSRLLYSLDDAKRDLRVHFAGHAYDNMVQIVTSQKNTDIQQFQRILDTKAQRAEVLNLVHVMIIGILLQMCDMVSADVMKAWLETSPTGESHGSLKRDLSERSGGFFSNVTSMVSSVGSKILSHSPYEKEEEKAHTQYEL